MAYPHEETGARDVYPSSTPALQRDADELGAQPTLDSEVSSTPSLVRADSASTSMVVHLIPDSELLVKTFLPSEEAAELARNTFIVPDDHDPVPFCVPQLQIGYDIPFARGYNDQLDEISHISQEDWLKFVDGLNMAMTSCPPLRIVAISGMILGLVPYHWAQIASTVMTTVAQTGMHILSKTLGDRYLRAANKRLFNPRGLTVRLCTTAAMLAILSKNPPGKKSAGQKAMGVVNSVGRGVGGLLMKVPVPIASKIVRKIADPAPQTRSSEPAHSKRDPNALVVRRLEVVKELSLPVSFAVPPVLQNEGVMDRMNAWSVKMKANRMRYAQTNVERRKRRLEAIESGNYDEYMQHYAAETMALSEKGELGFWGNLQQSRENHRFERDVQQYDQLHRGDGSNSSSFSGLPSSASLGTNSPGFQPVGTSVPPAGPYPSVTPSGEAYGQSSGYPNDPYANQGYAATSSGRLGGRLGSGGLRDRFGGAGAGGDRLGGGRFGGGLGGGRLGGGDGLGGRGLGGGLGNRGLGGGLIGLVQGLGNVALGSGGRSREQLNRTPSDDAQARASPPPPRGGPPLPSGGSGGVGDRLSGLGDRLTGIGIGGRTGGRQLGGGGNAGPLGLNSALQWVFGPPESALERKVRNDELKEYWNLNELVWIVVMKKDTDVNIEGIDIADSSEDTENVTDEQLREQMKIEMAKEDINGQIEADDRRIPQSPSPQ